MRWPSPGAASAMCAIDTPGIADRRIAIAFVGQAEAR
jgi:hypothetical protein